MNCPPTLEPYLRDLAGSTSEGFEPTDEDFIAIVGSVDKRAWDDVLERVTALEDSKRYDVRIVAISAYLAWREGGVGALPWIFEAVARTAGVHLSSFGPSKKRVAHLDIRTAWAFTTIVDDVEYHQKAGTPEWSAWTKELSPELSERIAATREEVEAALQEAGAKRASESLSKLAVSIDSNVHAIVAEEVARRAKAEAARVTPQESSSDMARPAGPSRIKTREEPMNGEQPRYTSDLHANSPRMDLAVSHSFLELVRKIEAFERLIERKKFQKAALVADDITELVSKFDPRTHFPELFSSFGKHLAEHIDTLAESWDRRETIGWKALEQYYRVDLQRFVDE